MIDTPGPPAKPFDGAPAPSLDPEGPGEFPRQTFSRDRGYRITTPPGTAPRAPPVPCPRARLGSRQPRGRGNQRLGIPAGHETLLTVR